MIARVTSPIMLLRLLISGFALILNGCDNAHIVVLDQNGAPVEGVLIQSNIQPWNAFFFDDEMTVKYTDSEGRATLPVGRWFTINLVEKEGYQFRPLEQFSEEFGHYIFGQAARGFTGEHPLVIRGWKRGAQADLVYVGGSVAFPDNIERCTLLLAEPDRNNSLSEPLAVVIELNTGYQPDPPVVPAPHQRFQRKFWDGKILIPSAALQEGRDIFLNEAPEAGYEDSIAFVKEKEFPAFKERRLYIKGLHNTFYGGGLYFLNPYSVAKSSLDKVGYHEADFQFWFNFTGSTNVMRSPEQTIWRSTHPVIFQRMYCLEAPKYPGAK